jgi:hypothetical protein
MLPINYELPAAVALILGGVLTCFAGYRLFRTVLGIYGFILGAMIASSVASQSNTAILVSSAIVGGLVGSLVLGMAYVVGIAMAGAGIGALIGHMVWAQYRTDVPPAVALVVVSVVGAVGALLVRRYVIIVATAFGGAWTVVVGAVNALAVRGVMRGASALDVWILYPTSLPQERWAPAAWILLGLLGSGVQLGLTAARKR